MVGRTENSIKNRFYSTLRKIKSDCVKEQTDSNSLNLSVLGDEKK